jgi:hypothetical protein
MLGDPQQATYGGSRREAQKLSFPPASLSVGLVDDKRQDIVTTAFRARSQRAKAGALDGRPVRLQASERVRRARLETAIGPAVEESAAQLLPKQDSVFSVVREPLPADSPVAPHSRTYGAYRERRQLG